MTDDLYERYKDALRRGHVAALRGRLDEALEAYRLAAQLAPARAMPHSSLGGIFLRLNRVEEALAEYAAAVARAPQDEGALLGQAEALEVVGRYSDAAVALDRVAQIQEAAGRTPEAADTLRRALELDDSPERIRRHRSLVRQVRLSAGDQAAEQALARALRLRESPAQEAVRTPAVPGHGQPAVAAPAAASAAIVPAEESAAAEPQAPATENDVYEIALRIAAMEGGLGEPGIPAAGADSRQAASPDVGSAGGEPVIASELDASGVAATAEAEPAVGEKPSPGAPAEPDVAREPVGVIDVDAGDGRSPIRLPVPTGGELVAAAEESDRAGDGEEARRLLVSAARAFSAEGRFEAALDTAHQVLRRHPSDVDGHLVLVELYVSRRWDSLAAEKLMLLGRLAELDDDDDTKQRLCEAASRAFPANGRLAALCS